MRVFIGYLDQTTKKLLEKPYPQQLLAYHVKDPYWM